MNKKTVILRYIVCPADCIRYSAIYFVLLNNYVIAQEGDEAGGVTGNWIRSNKSSGEAGDV